MAWEQGVAFIVMTTGLIEGGRKKCECYWPVEEGGETVHGNFQVGRGARIGLRW